MDNKIFILGLTGSIGMGKSTTSKFFVEAGVPVWDADAAVHKLYATNKCLIQNFAEVLPETVKDNKIDRAVLRKIVSRRPELLKQIEALVHPFVAADRQAFLRLATSQNSGLVVVDHPLLFETGEHKWCDAVLVVSAQTDVQKQRVMSRKGMTEEAFEMLLAKQLPDAEKRERADFVLETTTHESAKDYVLHLIKKITDGETQHA